jgi:hypothetical protein
MTKPKPVTLDSLLRKFMASNGLSRSEIETELAKPVQAKPPAKHAKRRRPRRDEALGAPGPPRRRSERFSKPGS